MPGPVERWVQEVEKKTAPSNVVWCDGSDREWDQLVGLMLDSGALIRLNSSAFPNCYLHRSHPSDVSRTEQLTFICPKKQEDAGPTNNWMAPEDAKSKVGKLFEGAMRGRTMYVVPYLMGPAGSPNSKLGVEITDSPYVVASMRITTRTGKIASDRFASGDDIRFGLHSTGDLPPDRRFILH